MKRRIYEFFNLNIYLLGPIIVSLAYNLLNKRFKINLLNNHIFLENSIDISLAVLGVLLTLLGLFAALPPSKYEKAMIKFGYYKIIFNTLLIGVVATILHLIIYLSGVLGTLQIYLFIIYMSETVIASCWIYRILKLIYRK